ncbi:MAG: hypothetical protein ACLUFL_04615 [Flavonifractor plautii]
MEFEAMVSRQREFWNTGATRSVEWRLTQLKSWSKPGGAGGGPVRRPEGRGKAAYESWLSEIGMTLGSCALPAST